MADQLGSMAAFVTAAEAGSYASAAVRLGMSAQMVAKHVAGLEQRLGARLLNRTTRRQSLTPLGQAYYERCKAVLDQVQSADALALEMNALPTGKLRISAPVTFGGSSLMPFITAFLRDYPDVQVDLQLTDRFTDLVADGVEAAFRIGPLSASGADSASLVARPLAPYQLVACASPSYLSTHGTPQAPADLARHECLGYAYWARPADSQWQFSQDGKEYRVPVSSRLQVNESRALTLAAVEGFGIVLGPDIFLAAALASGELVQVLPDYQAPSRPMHLLYPADRLRTAKLRTFIDRALAAFQ
jgi:DNA-binding transcriptional LysR family regulator